MDLLRLLFPGFFDERPLHSSVIAPATGVLLDSVLGRLQAEIEKSLEYSPPPELAESDLKAAARRLTLKFLSCLPCIRELLGTDIEAAYNGDPAALSEEEVIVAYPFVEAIAVQRLAHELYLDKIPLIPRIMTEWAHARTGMDLHPGARIGAYFFVDHCTGTVIGETSVIGNHVKMYQGVGLVARSLAAGQALRGQKRHPTVEDRVTIYAGATIIGGDTSGGRGDYDRGECLPDPQRAALFAGGAGRRQRAGDREELSRPRLRRFPDLRGRDRGRGRRLYTGPQSWLLSRPPGLRPRCCSVALSPTLIRWRARGAGPGPSLKALPTPG